MIGGVGLLGRIGQGGLRMPAAEGPAADFTLSGNVVTTAWGVTVVGELVPNEATPAGAYFVLVDNPAGFAVENG